MSTTDVQKRHVPCDAAEPRVTTTGRRRLVSFVVVLLAALGIGVALAGSAGATVSANGLQRSYNVGDGCTFLVGDRARSDLWAQGDAQVTGCSHRHSVSTYVELWRAAPGATYAKYATSNVLTSPNAFGADNYTNARCGGGGAYFYTAAWVDFDGRGWYGPYYSYVNNGPYSPGSC